MKRLILTITIVLVLISVNVDVANAQINWQYIAQSEMIRHMGGYGGYGYGDYGYGLGGIISEIGRIQVANRVIGLAENQQRQQPHVVREYVTVSVSAPAPAGNQYFDDVRIKGEIQRLKDENQKLKMENEELFKGGIINKEYENLSKQLKQKKE